MIPLSTFNLLIAVMLLLIIYSVIDHKNQLYANIVTAFLSALLAAFLASVISTDVVYDVIGGITTMVSSPSIGYFLQLVSTVMFGYTLFMAYGVISKSLGDKKAQTSFKNEEDGYE
jgi:ABC-type transport system involved in multi-copper enzyme maturation permease subunit